MASWPPVATGLLCAVYLSWVPQALLLTQSRNESASPSLLKVFGGKWRGISISEIQTETLALQFWSVLGPSTSRAPQALHSTLSVLSSPSPPLQAPFLSCLPWRGVGTSPLPSLAFQLLPMTVIICITHLFPTKKFTLWSRIWVPAMKKIKIVFPY